MLLLFQVCFNHTRGIAELQCREERLGMQYSYHPDLAGIAFLAMELMSGNDSIEDLIVYNEATGRFIVDDAALNRIRCGYDKNPSQNLPGFRREFWLEFYELFLNQMPEVLTDAEIKDARRKGLPGAENLSYGCVGPNFSMLVRAQLQIEEIFLQETHRMEEVKRSMALLLEEVVLHQTK